MNIEQLQEEIDKLDINSRNYHIGKRGYFDSCFNLIRHKNGMWDVFYGERGLKRFQSVHETEDEACRAFLKLLKKHLNTKELEKKPVYWKGYRKYSFHAQHVIGISLFVISLLLGIFFLGYQIYRHEFNFMFWFFVVWDIFFGVLAFCWLNDRTYELFEYIATPLVYGILILGFVAAMIAAPFFIIPQIQSGEIGKDYYVSLTIGELGLGAAVWAFYHFFIKEYVDELKDYIKEKKAKDQ